MAAEYDRTHKQWYELFSPKVIYPPGSCEFDYKLVPCTTETIIARNWNRYLYKSFLRTLDIGIWSSSKPVVVHFIMRVTWKLSSKWTLIFSSVWYRETEREHKWDMSFMTKSYFNAFAICILHTYWLPKWLDFHSWNHEWHVRTSNWSIPNRWLLRNKKSNNSQRLDTLGST